MTRPALIVLLAAGAFAAPAHAATKEVSVGGFAFSPVTVEIAPGDTVRWAFVGPDTNHSTTSDAGQAESWESDPGVASPNHPVGDAFSHTFNATGSFGYSCRVHPSMRGTVRVTAPGQPQPPQPPQPPADAVAPVFASARVAVARRRVSFTLDEAASVAAKLRGRKTKRTLTLAGKAGTNVLKLPKRLSAGRYALTLIATDAAGNASAPLKLKFTVKR
jgi:plastocyanin